MTNGKHSVGIGAVMTPDPEVLHVDHTLVEAAGRMRDLDVGLMFVVDGDQLVGAITDRDICCRAVAETADPAQMRVQQAMTRHIVFCDEDESAETALRIMRDEGVRRLAVLNRERELVGVASLADLARTHPDAAAPGRTLRDLAAPTEDAKKPHAGLPTGGRAVAARKGVPAIYAERPRLPRRSKIRRPVANGD